uniref:Uncharacterized protein n=1 Tax=Arundo donax TaxID=35708 RepID=A0A0A9F964_ARUDO
MTKLSLQYCFICILRPNMLE